jgi:hypothetical protein
MTEALFLTALALLWIGIAYTVVLAIGGFIFFQRWRRRMFEDHVAPDLVWPGVSIIIPAHNEAEVIERSLARFALLDYPPELLQIVVVNDGSTDKTGELCEAIAEGDQRFAIVHIAPSIGGRGKSAALNVGLASCVHPYVAVYDADHRPHGDALWRLVAGLHRDAGHDRYAGAVGRIVKMNRRRSLLNRFCSLEWTAFQWIIQAGRSQLFDVVTFPGTHFIVSREVLQSVGGWDPNALTEDLDLSLRVYASGHRVRFCPDATSEEQDPENLHVWFRQRLRWVVGNYYVLRKHARLATLRHPKILLDYAALAFAYVALLGAVLVSDVLFIVGFLTTPSPDLLGTHYMVLWALSALVFVALLMLVQAMEGEDGWTTPLLAVLMYVSYAQLWLLVATRGLVRFLRTGGRMTWVKTPRFQS